MNVSGYLETEKEAAVGDVNQHRLGTSSDLARSLAKSQGPEKRGVLENMDNTRTRLVEVHQVKFGPKEYRIAQGIVAGKSNKQIAELEHTSEQVIKNYSRKIYAKTRVAGIGNERVLFVLWWLGKNINENNGEKLNA